jgi:hypothetical protein
METKQITRAQFLKKFNLKDLPVCPYCGMPIDVVTVREIIKETGEVTTAAEFQIIPE